MLYLVQSPTAEKFLTLASTGAGRRAQLGDPDKFEGMSQKIADMHETLRKGVERVIALPADRTRNNVLKHLAGKQLAQETAKQLGFARDDLATKADNYHADGVAVADAFFEMRSERSAIDGRIIDWVQTKAQNGDINQIRKAALDDAQLATVVYQTPAFLLGINATSQTKLRFDVIEKHTPTAFKAMTRANDLYELLPRVDRTIAAIHPSFYSEEMAAQAASHVEVA